MAGSQRHRWVFSWMCRWFPGRAKARRRPVVRYVKPTLTILEERFSPTAFGMPSPVEIAPPP
jgi:hypothetical protein